jgi:hypothetical protein
MQHNANPPDTARVLIDPDGVSEPQFVEIGDLAIGGGGADLSGIRSDIEALRAAVDRFYTSVHMVNSVRGCVNINTSTHELEISEECFLFMDTGARVIAPSDVPWIEGISADGMYYVAVDNVPGEMEVRVIGLNSDNENHPAAAMSNPVVIGMFNVAGGKVQGLSFCNDDVKVDGKYIYDNPPKLGVYGDAILLVDDRGGMNINTADKAITLLSGATLYIPDKGTVRVPAGNYPWNKGSAQNYYESGYRVYVDISDNEAALSIVADTAMFISSGESYLVGSFYWTGTAVGGINFKNDVRVDGNYIYGSGDGGSSYVISMEEITSSGDCPVPAGCKWVDAFLVGGGGAGGGGSLSGGGGGGTGGGGGGGYTTLAMSIAVIGGETLNVEIGAGGIAPTNGSHGGAGGASRIKRGSTVLASALGGQGGRSDYSGNESPSTAGGNGGSGGGAGVGGSGTTGGAGGSDGSDGSNANVEGQTILGGTGQHTSTRCPFNNVLYAGGGGGARAASLGGNGGAGGGGGASTSAGVGVSGAPNTGGGGGGTWYTAAATAGAGGSGIVVLRYRG